MTEENNNGNGRNNIWLLRTKMEFSQKQLAYILGHKNSSLLNRWEKGMSNPNLEGALQLMIALSTPIEAIFQEKYESYKLPILERKNEVKKQIAEKAQKSENAEKPF